jgi:hypothetical protein
VAAVVIARNLAEKHERGIDETNVVEIQHGWFFRWLGDGKVGSNGFVIAKEDGSFFMLGSAFSVDRDLDLYDQGFRSHRYDLVVLEVRDLRQTIDALMEIAPTMVEPEYEAGTVWRIPRPLTEGEIVGKLDLLPAVSPTSYFISGSRRW